LSPSVVEFLLARKSAPIAELKEPAPGEEQIATMLAIASRVPDHGMLSPWRFVLYRGESRVKVGELLAVRAEERDGPLNDARRQQERTRFSRAPLVIGVVSRQLEHPKIPQWEMMLSGGAAAMNLLLAANALGFGANWITNWYSDDAEGRRILGLAPSERVIGFVHVGTYDGVPFDRPRPDVDTLVSDYAGPWEG
jgi:nitroreductase